MSDPYDQGCESFARSCKEQPDDFNDRSPFDAEDVELTPVQGENTEYVLVHFSPLQEVRVSLDKRGNTPGERKNAPVARGVLDYFPDALLAVAELSRIGNEQHNPGQPMHWAREKSTDHADCIVRHMLDRGELDTDGVRHSAKVAWRALAMLQLEIEAARKAGGS